MTAEIRFPQPTSLSRALAMWLGSTRSISHCLDVQVPALAQHGCRGARIFWASADPFASGRSVDKPLDSRGMDFRAIDADTLRVIRRVGGRMLAVGSHWSTEQGDAKRSQACFKRPINGARPTSIPLIRGVHGSAAPRMQQGSVPHVGKATNLHVPLPGPHLKVARRWRRWCW